MFTFKLIAGGILNVVIFGGLLLLVRHVMILLSEVYRSCPGLSDVPTAGAV